MTGHHNHNHKFDIQKHPNFTDGQRALKQGEGILMYFQVMSAAMSLPIASMSSWINPHWPARISQMMIIVYWYLFSNHYTRECIHSGEVGCDHHAHSLVHTRTQDRKDWT